MTSTERAFTLAALLVGACANAVPPGEPDAAAISPSDQQVARSDARTDASGQPDAARPATDAAPSATDAGTPSMAPDQRPGLPPPEDFGAPAPPTAPPDAAAAPPSGCARECKGVECGPVPDGCGGEVQCGDCGDGTRACVQEGAGRFRGQVSGAVHQVQAEHPEYFDPNDAMGDSLLVIDDAAYGPAVVAALLGAHPQLTALVDPNDDHEIRVRDGGRDAADNYLIRTHGGNRSAYRYTSTCDPAGF